MDFEIFKLRHREMDCVGVRLSREDSRNEQIRKIPGIRWSKTNRCWYGECSVALEDAFFLIFSERAVSVSVDSGQEGKKLTVGSRQDFGAAVGGDSSQEVEAGGAKERVALDASALEAFAKFKQHLEVNRNSQHTIKNYSDALMVFLKFFKDERWEDLDEGDIERFQRERIIERNLSDSYQNTMISAIKRFYKVNSGKVIKPEFIKRPRSGHHLPHIFSLEQVAKLLSSIKNQKHRMLLSVGYGCGLRSGEVVKLKPEDIHTDQGMLAIRNGKGNRDRMVPISEKLISQLREYYKIYRPKVWLFEGVKEGTPYSQRSLQMVFKCALARNRFPEKHRFHDLRHSYATHMMDAGTNQHIIQKILGHKNSKTTEIYTHVSNTLLQRVYNPFDNLKM